MCQGSFADPLGNPFAGSLEITIEHIKYKVFACYSVLEEDGLDKILLKS